MSDKMPPVTLEEFKRDLLNETFVVYAYIGKASDPGWDAAEVAESLLAGVRVYLVRDREDLKEWIGAKKPRGVIFGIDDTVHCLLDKAQTEDLRVVIDALQEAMA